jgi:uncharacterized protein (TIGR02466 family)
MKYGVQSAFQIPISYYENLELKDDLKNYILSKNSKGIESNVTPLIKQNLIESKFDFFRDETPIVRKTAQWITNMLTDTINTLQMEEIDYNFVYNESWFHITKTNGMHEPHTHPNCSWCGVYYLQSGDSDSGHTVFQNPVCPTHIDRGNLYLNSESSIRVLPKDGLLVLFPSFLIHYQALYKGVEDRIVVAFNASVNQREEN